ncbi:glycosyltransferase family 2 protein [Marivita sp. GX14005]|uniref:glycosyltransferase family 2 protein n=1 Tax=Marivita sp. GX14005 TaxID=2942276 RepID=UPI002018D4BE|nr:glycosyltransferase family 2 protein [Marivita sp. GX14005]MCL3881579.1 glycosyltransferase family 2 protein [Marivita sp. GX14005]
MNMKSLRQAGPSRFDPSALPVVALAHNEGNILPEFLAHYRALGPVTFLIVDDGSTDDTADILVDASDVTVFHPADGTSYSADKATWRSELLDLHADGRWCLVPDLDEHFVFTGADTLRGYIDQLEAEGADAVVTLMIDMYGDLPLRDHVYPGNSGLRLSARFPHFDGPDQYAMRRSSHVSRKTYPTPPVVFHGGLRSRLQRGELLAGASPIVAWVLSNRLGLDRPLNGPPGILRRLLIEPMARRHFAGDRNLTKLGLLRWQAGMRFNGGAHKLTRQRTVSESIAGFLHYPITRGAEGVRYIAERGQHASGGKQYKSLLTEGRLDRSPVYPGTRTFQTPDDLGGLLRPVPKPL